MCFVLNHTITKGCRLFYAAVICPGVPPGRSRAHPKRCFSDLNSGAVARGPSYTAELRILASVRSVILITRIGVLIIRMASPSSSSRCTILPFRVKVSVAGSLESEAVYSPMSTPPLRVFSTSTGSAQSRGARPGPSSNSTGGAVSVSGYADTRIIVSITGVSAI